MTEKKTPRYLQGIEVHEVTYGQSKLEKPEGADREYSTLWCHMRGSLEDGTEVRIATLHEPAVDLIVALRRSLPEDLSLPGISRLAPGYQTNKKLGKAKFYLDVAELSERKTKDGSLYVFERFQPSGAPDVGLKEAKAKYLEKEKAAFGARAKDYDAKTKSQISDRDVDAMMNSMNGEETPAPAKDDTSAKREAAPQETVAKPEAEERKPATQETAAPEKEAAAKPADEAPEKREEEDKEFGNEAETDADYTETTLEKPAEDEPAATEANDQPAKASTEQASSAPRRRLISNPTGGEASGDKPKEDAQEAGTKTSESTTPGRRRLLASGGGASQPAQNEQKQEQPSKPETSKETPSNESNDEPAYRPRRRLLM